MSKELNINLSLDRIRLLLDALGNPFEDLKIIHIAGTNGKGSVCAFMASILKTCGYKTGQFNSPHFLDPSDSILIDGKPSVLYADIYSKVFKLSELQNFKCTPFEIMTATAFMIFKEEKVDIALVEVGLGGRLDATNVIPPPLIAVITSISLDHMEYLGDTVQDIAKEKCGIIKNGSKAVIVSSQSFDQVNEIVESFTDKCTDCEIVKVVLNSIEINSEKDCDWIRIYYFSEPCYLPIKLYGNHQINNACTSLLALSRLEKIDDKFSFSFENIYKGMENVYWPGRLEKIQFRNRSIFVDGAHNVAGAKSVKEFLKKQNYTAITWILGFSLNKDLNGILRELVGENDTVIGMPFKAPENMPWIKCISPFEIGKIVKSMSLEVVYLEAADFDDAFKFADQSSSQIVLCGSLYLVSQFHSWRLNSS